MTRGRTLALAVAFTVGVGLTMVGPDRIAVGNYSYAPGGACATPAATPNTGLVNMGFEQGLTGWRLGRVSDEVSVIGADAFNAPFQGGSMLRLGKARASASDPQPVGPNEVCQDFVVDSPNESFAFRLFTWDGEGYDNFEFRVTVVNPATGQVVERYHTGAWDYFTWAPELRKTGWTIVQLDLAPYVGQTLQVWFTAGGTWDDVFSFWAYVDQATKDLKAVNLKAKPRKAKPGKRTKLIATVTPCLGHVGHPVEFQQRKKGGWKVVGAGALDLFCQTSVKKKVKDKMRFRAFSPESGDHFAAHSNVVKVKPKAKKGKK